MKKSILTPKRKALAAITGCVLFWGFSFISTKIAVAVFPPMTLGMLRFAVALVFLFLIKQKLAPTEKLRPKNIPVLFAAGFSGVTLYFFFENNGVSLVSASEASIALASIPAVILITEWLTGKFKNKKHKRITSDLTEPEHAAQKSEQPQIKGHQWIGCFFSIAGVLLVARVSLAVSGSILGYIYMSGAALSWVAYCFLSRSLFSDHSTIFIVFWQSLAGFLCFIPFSIMEFGSWGTVTTEVIIHILFLGIFCSAIGHFFYVLAMENLSVTISGIFLNLIPVVTVIAGFFMLGERLSPLQWLGAVFVIGGVTLAMKKQQN